MGAGFSGNVDLYLVWLAGLSWKECDLGTDPEVGEWKEVVGWGESQIYSGAWFVVYGGMSVYVCLWEGAESGEIG